MADKTRLIAKDVCLHLPIPAMHENKFSEHLEIGGHIIQQRGRSFVAAVDGHVILERVVVDRGDVPRGNSNKFSRRR